MGTDQKMCRRGVTLVEMIVVVALMGLLITLLVVGVNGARQAASRVDALAGTQAVSASIHAYASEFHDFFPFGLGRSVPFFGDHWSRALLRSNPSLLRLNPPNWKRRSLVGFGASWCFFFPGHVFLPGGMDSLEDVRPTGQRLGDVGFPSAKGMLWRDVDSQVPGIAPICCVPQSERAGQIAFADGSVATLHWTSLRGARPLVLERDNIGFPVYSTWMGLLGMDR